MSDNFEQTVNLKAKMEKLRAAERAALMRQNEAQNEPSEPARTAPIKETKFQRTSSSAAAIDQVYNDEIGEPVKADLQRISRPEIRRANLRWLKPVLVVVALLIVGVSIYLLFSRGHIGKKAVVQPPELKWYAVKLINGEEYYGQIGDTSADPVVLTHVYYNYDQLNKKTGESASATSETSTLRLVKRGQETHGPSGIMDVVRAQVVYMEPLKDDSKVLKAILEYEKQ